MLFSKEAKAKDEGAPTIEAPRPQSKEEKRAAAANDAAMSVIAQGMRVVGDIECSGVVKIEGIVEGSVRGARQLLLGRQGHVKGDLQGREIVLGGRVDGTVVGEERVEIQATAQVIGDVHTKSIIILEGGRINGAVRMDNGTTVAAGRPTPNGMRAINGSVRAAS
jgi:cytoskeletal protein CcmA (bactofilin family)